MDARRGFFFVVVVRDSRIIGRCSSSAATRCADPPHFLLSSLSLSLYPLRLSGFWLIDVYSGYKLIYSCENSAERVVFTTERCEHEMMIVHSDGYWRLWAAEESSCTARREDLELLLAADATPGGDTARWTLENKRMRKYVGGVPRSVCLAAADIARV